MILREENTLEIDGCSYHQLASQYGTPLMVISRNHIREKCQQIRKGFTEKHVNVKATYAGKAFLPLAMCKIIDEEGLNLDVVSGGELYTAIKAGFPPERIEFNGNNKSEEELEMAVSYGVGRIIMDGVDELLVLEQVCQRLNKKAQVLMRISPGVDTHTHQYITTGNLDSKFGLPVEGGILEQGVKGAAKSKWVDLLGFHFHIGSQLHDNEPYILATEILMDIIEEMEDKYQFQTEEINVGGGFGIRYTDEDTPMPYDYFLDPVMAIIEDRFASRNRPRPTVVIEPGRSLIAGAGVTLYTVGTTKEVPGIRKYVAVDGGMTDNIRPALYQSKYECWVGSSDPSNPKTEELEKVTICGKCCESGDILVTDAMVKSPKRGDIFAVFDTGAYCYPMASNYNKLPILEVVLADKGESRVIVKRQTYEEMISRELL